MKRYTRIFFLGKQNTDNAVIYYELSNGKFGFFDNVNYSVHKDPRLRFVGCNYIKDTFDSIVTTLSQEYFGENSGFCYIHEDIDMSLIGNQEFRKLATIGGHKLYHYEGNALTHTLLVYEYAVDMFGADHLMCKVALLHDIGKIYTSIKNGENDWSYQDHSTCGALKGILAKFVDLNDENFSTYQWYIKNHIKPLNWQKSGKIDFSARMSDLCKPMWLRDLALCDIYGSISKEDNTPTIEYLKSINVILQDIS